MRNLTIAGLSLVALLSSLFPTQAKEPLTDKHIQNFMAAMQPLQKLGQKYDFTAPENIEENSKKSLGENKAPTDLGPMSQSLMRVKDHKSYPEFAAIVTQAGFSSPAEWAETGDRVMKAYLAAKIYENVTPGEIEEIQDSIAEVKKNEYLSTETKTKILDGLTESLAIMTNSSEETKADQAALQPYIKKLDKLFEVTE